MSSYLYSDWAFWSFSDSVVIRLWQIWRQKSAILDLLTAILDIFISSEEVFVLKIVKTVGLTLVKTTVLQKFEWGEKFRKNRADISPRILLHGNTFIKEHSFNTQLYS